ncbi:putative nucleic acid-binding protein [Sphaerotilus hippei]|uniref:Putative nucleic acid-binding protein n=1 Tax=Sphaerotilus hippei TaxID=744406 RepID=A0A318H9C1_9BURK|nr:PIN domain-containing protein [Sphaerotilus hippei]PXW99518.1 putative nucleic acid-binding protein [Sphaerotilus hippei]
MTPAETFAATLAARRGKPPRVVLDATIVVSALMFGGGAAAQLRHAWQNGVFRPMMCKATLFDLTTRLALPQLGFSRYDQQVLLVDYLPHTLKVRVPHAEDQMRAGDPPGLPYVRLAMAGQAHAVVTADQELLGMKSAHVCPMLSLDTFIELLKQVRLRSVPVAGDQAGSRRHVA